MGSINLKELAKNTNLTKKTYTYVDLHLDVQQVTRSISNSNTIRSIKGKDIEIDPDEAAIRNSIFNILNTRPGQRFLIPAFGCNLLGFIGQPITTQTGNEIGRTIYQAIKIWEPRVKVDDILVKGSPETHTYDITISVTIPALKRTDIKIISTLTSSGILESQII
jgi:phage baseplate assembly protein W